jgi:quercetin dioxygenase-like cupin family protein
MENKTTAGAVTITYQDKVTFRPDRFNAVALAENERIRVLLACFEPGQFIPVHKPGVDLTLVVLEGEGEVMVGERMEKIGPGSVVFIPAGEKRGIKAGTRLVALHTVTPPPTEADHAGVAEKLKQGIWP